MKYTLYCTLFLLVNTLSCTTSIKDNQLDCSRLNFSVIDVNRRKVNLQEYIISNKIKVVYFYSKNSCKLCFLNEEENLNKLNRSQENNLVIITNLKTIRELKSLAVGYDFHAIFKVCDNQSNIFDKGSFYLNVENEEIIIPNSNEEDSEKKVSIFLEKFMR